VIPGRSPLQRRRREATRLEITEAATALFLERGFDATTVEQIASTAGISLRTFYRYCDSKDDVLTPVLVTGGDRFVELVIAAAPERPLAEVVLAAATAVMDDPEHPNLRRDASMIMLTTPALRLRWLALVRDWQERLVPAVAARFGWPPDCLEAAATAALIASAVNSAVEHSLRTGMPLARSFAQSIAMLDGGLAGVEANVGMGGR
jgi:AcrR family transcriptional regulator